MAIVNCIYPVVMILVALVIKKCSYEYKGNASGGYSTPRARASKQAWTYAQIIAPGVFIKYGIRALIGCLIVSILPLAFIRDNSQLICSLIGLTALVNSFIKVEKSLINN
ncbi:SdpI family protein [Cellulosilyticum ruminicola]|uniref:hypothetical protein n=1 Tax=Cellulosilyticum ruminicola TaxID=425254 RepID=UPI0006D2AEC6|nr:hypothetical protein [Cellulosilyticum ruminicola]